MRRTSQIAMKKWLRPSMVMMALLALMASALPSSAWACPVSGLVGAATQVCQRTANINASDSSTPGAMSDIVPCCAQQQAISCLNTCCHSVPQLPGSDDKGGPLEKAHAGNTAISSHLAQATQNVVMISVRQSAPLMIEPTQAGVISDGASPLLLKPLHTPATQAGRAPPSL